MTTHSDYRASDESGIVIFRHYLGLRAAGNSRAAVFRRSGSRFSGSLSEMRTLIPRYPCLAKPLWASMPQSTVDRAHLGRIRRRCMTVRSAQSYSESPKRPPKRFGFDLIKAALRESGIVCMY